MSSADRTPSYSSRGYYLSLPQLKIPWLAHWLGDPKIVNKYNSYFEFWLWSELLGANSSLSFPGREFCKFDIQLWSSTKQMYSCSWTYFHNMNLILEQKKSGLTLQRFLCLVQSFLWQSLLQYESNPQPEHFFISPVWTLQAWQIFIRLVGSPVCRTGNFTWTSAKQDGSLIITLKLFMLT